MITAGGLGTAVGSLAGAPPPLGGSRYFGNSGSSAEARRACGGSLWRRVLCLSAMPSAGLIRHYGLLANCHKAAKRAACRTAFQLPEPDPPLIETIQQFMQRVAQLDVIRCTRCNAGSFHVLRAIAPVRQRLHPKLATGPPRS